MRNYLRAIAGFSLLSLFFSCQNEEKDFQQKGYSLYCWPSKTACDNREYGIEFSYQVMIVDPANPPPANKRVATMICCRYVEELMDSLALYNSLVQQHLDKGLGNFNRRCRIGEDIEVFASFTVEGTFMQYSLSTLGFSDKANPFGFEFSVPQLDNFPAFRDDVMAFFRKCCLGEEDD